MASTAAAAGPSRDSRIALTKGRPAIEATSGRWEDATPQDFLQALRRREAARATELAMQLKDSPDPSARLEAADALAEAAVGALKEGNFARLQELLPALAELAPERAVSPLLRLAADERGETKFRIRALEALGAIRSEAAVPPLISILEGREPLYWQAAANALARTGGEAAMGFLFGLIERGRADLGRTAAWAIDHSGDEAAREALRRMSVEGRAKRGAVPPELRVALAQAEK